MARSRSPPSRPDGGGDVGILKSLPFQLSFNKRDQIFLGLLVAFWLLFNLILTDLAATLQFWLLNTALVYTAYQLAPFLYNSLHFIEKDLVEPTGKAVLITGPCNFTIFTAFSKHLFCRLRFWFRPLPCQASRGQGILRLCVLSQWNL